MSIVMQVLSETGGSTFMGYDQIDKVLLFYVQLTNKTQSVCEAGFLSSAVLFMLSVPLAHCSAVEYMQCICSVSYPQSFLFAQKCSSREANAWLCWGFYASAAHTRQIFHEKRCAGRGAASMHTGPGRGRKHCQLM